MKMQELNCKGPYSISLYRYHWIENLWQDSVSIVFVGGKGISQSKIRSIAKELFGEGDFRVGMLDKGFPTGTLVLEVRNYKKEELTDIIGKILTMSGIEFLFVKDIAEGKLYRAEVN